MNAQDIHPKTPLETSTWLKIAPIFVVVALLLSANGLLATGLPLRWSSGGMAAQTIAQLAACGYAGVLLGGWLAPRTVHRLGSCASFLAFVALFASSCLIFLATWTPFALGIARILAGAAIAGLYLLIESRLHTLATVENRARLLTAYMVDLYLAQAAGSGLTSLGSPEGALVPSLAIALILTSAFGVRQFSLQAPAHVASVRRTRLSLLATAPEGYACGVAAGIVLGTFYGLGPVFARARLSTHTLVGPFMAMAMLGGVLGLLAAGRLASVKGTTNVALASLAIGIWALAVLPASMHGNGATMIAIAGFGATAFTLYPLASACVNATIPTTARVEANGLFILCSGIGGTLGPLIAGRLVPVVGVAAPFMVIAAATWAAGAFVWLRRIMAIPTQAPSRHLGGPS